MYLIFVSLLKTWSTPDDSHSQNVSASYVKEKNWGHQTRSPSKSPTHHHPFLQPQRKSGPSSFSKAKLSHLFWLQTIIFSLFFSFNHTFSTEKASSLSLCVQLFHLIKKLLTYEIHWYLQFSLKYIHKIRWVDEWIDGQICDKPNTACTYANHLMIFSYWICPCLHESYVYINIYWNVLFSFCIVFLRFIYVDTQRSTPFILTAV